MKIMKIYNNKYRFWLALNILIFLYDAFITPSSLYDWVSIDPLRFWLHTFTRACFLCHRSCKSLSKLYDALSTPTLKVLIASPLNKIWIQSFDLTPTSICIIAMVGCPMIRPVLETLYLFEDYRAIYGWFIVVACLAQVSKWIDYDQAIRFRTQKLQSS